MENIGLISYNILNHNSGNLKMLFKNKKIDKITLNELIKKELVRYKKIIPNFLEILKDLSQNNILFLQEVNGYLLNKIKKKFKLVYHTTEKDIVNKQENIIKEEYRVIILPDSFNKSSNYNDIILETDKFKKNGLMVRINDLVLVNVHLDWKANYNEIEKFAEKIYGEINKNYNDLTNIKIIIAGDFNKSVKIVEKHFINKINKNSDIQLVNSYKIFNTNEFTSYTTDPKENKKFDVIDHILTWNIKTTPTKIIDKYNNIELFIHIDKLIEILNDNNMEPKYFSDHKIIQVNFNQ